MTNARRWIPAAEVAAFYSLVHLIIWGSGRFRPTAVVAAALMIALCIASNRIHGDSRRRVGFDPDQFWPCALRVSLVTVPVVLPLLYLGLQKRFYWPWDVAFVLAGYPIWGFAQEYALLGFVNNRLEDALPGQETLIPWINGLLFSLAHLPNPILMTATFAAGVTFTAIFRRHRNLIPIALAHAAVGTAIGLAFADVSGSMAVGPGYLWRVGLPPGIVP